MDNVKDDAYYVEKLKSDLEFIVAHMRGIDIEELNGNGMAMRYCLIQCYLE